MREVKINIKKNLRLLKFFIISAFTILFALFVVALLVRFNFYITGWGNIENEVEIPIVNKCFGKISTINIKNGQVVLADQVIAKVNGNDHKTYDIKSPKTGKFLEIGDADFNVGKEIAQNQICGIVEADGAYFKALVADTDILDLREGQDCIIKISAYEAENYPPIHGKVFYITDLPTSVKDRNFYPVFCTLEENFSMKTRNKVGMGGSIKIQKGKSNIFNILFGRRERDDN